MAVRSSMAHLVAYVRRLIGDADGAQFTDDAILQVLDLYRMDVSREAVASPQAEAPYTVFRSAFGFWEADATFEDASRNTVSPVEADWLVGTWTFPAQSHPTLYISGKRYDVYGAAAELLEQWASALAREYDFSTDGDTFRRSQQAEALLRQAAQYRARSWMSVGVGRLERGDVVGYG